MTEFKGETVTNQGEQASYIYRVPKNAAFLYFYLVGGGGSGGRPNAAATTIGAGGGGSTGITCALCPTILLPETLVVRVTGIAAGASVNNTNGVTASSASVHLYTLPTGVIAQGNYFLFATGGSLGQAAGTGGAGGAAMTAANARWSALGLWVSQAGGAGGAGATGAGTAVAFNATLPLTGGGGGSGSTTAAIGGGITAQAGYQGIPTILGGASGGGAGFSGMGIPNPWGGCGGTGGGSIAGAGVGGAGGNAGWYGCGGGGGGNAQTTSGNGGNGGAGYCLIVAF